MNPQALPSPTTATTDEPVLPNSEVIKGFKIVGERLNSLERALNILAQGGSQPSPAAPSIGGVPDGWQPQQQLGNPGLTGDLAGVEKVVNLLRPFMGDTPASGSDALLKRLGEAAIEGMLKRGQQLDQIVDRAVGRLVAQEVGLNEPIPEHGHKITHKPQ